MKRKTDPAHHARRVGWRLVAAIAVWLTLIHPAMSTPSNTTADHTKFKSLAGPFASGEEVTKACLACRNNFV